MQSIQSDTLMCLAAEREEYDRKFLTDCGVKVDPLPSQTVQVEIVMQGESVRKAREMHALRHRKPLMGERRASECGMVDLGEIT